jgi:hypothetical protein
MTNKGIIYNSFEINMGTLTSAKIVNIIAINEININIKWTLK